jgi:hypothetical protein
MEFTKVDSSQLEAVAYDAENKVLQVEFKGGSIYEYENVESSIHEELMKAESIGRFFNQNIKKNIDIKYKKISDRKEKPDA